MNLSPTIRRIYFLLDFKSEVLIGRKNGQIDLFNSLSESLNSLLNVNDGGESTSNCICGIECLIKRFL